MAATTRTPVLAGNWKMFKTVAETVVYLNEVKILTQYTEDCEIVIAPPFPALAAAAEAVQGSSIRIAAQNLHWEKEGAFTGEVSAPMLRAAGCSDVIIGHSERRQYFGETDETVNRRVRAALEGGLRPIVCVGETLAEREARQTTEVLLRQIDRALASLTPESASPIIVAYEPVWAIGTGRTATPEIAEEAHQTLRGRVRKNLGAETAERLRILYGGSVKPANIQGLMACPNIDGGLVGGASLEPALMAAIIHYQS
ncbi:MAG: triose-phosphate isomerase [Bryobacterales bacterium]|nr:triose-phosphate isomerase [Bryobacterales bacterium]